MGKVTGLAALLGLLLAGSAAAQDRPPVDPEPIACPASVGPNVRCQSVRDANGAWLVLAMPETWNRRLIVHAHGGPRTGQPEADDELEDLSRFSVMVRQGYAWVGTTYRRPGYGVRSAAADVEEARKVAWAVFGKPERTILHGQSWGGNVAAKVAELHALDLYGGRNYDGVLLTNGVLMGGTRAYGFRADLRAVYQFYCRNHPAREDGAYPVWQGLPEGADMTRAELRRRIVACTGWGLSQRDRTADQSRRLHDILAVTGIVEDELVDHMNWATFLFQDLVHRRLKGLNPFDNSTTVYRGSSDDEALNAGVPRFRADPEAVARLAWDADLSGLIVAPTMTLHALHDPTVSFDAERIYAETVARAGRSDLLVQAATDEDQHSKLEDKGYLTALAALERWIDSGVRPDPEQFQADCLALPQAGACRFLGGGATP